MNFEYGSLWRKWDLHVHTPLSILHQNYKMKPDFDEYLKSELSGQYKELTDIDKRMYCFIKELFNKAIEKEIAAVGVTDYYFIDGYKYIRSVLDDKSKLNLIFKREVENDDSFLDKVKSIKLFPNVEFRTNTIIRETKENLPRESKLQIHVVFSDKCNCEEIESQFISRLKLTTPDPHNSLALTHESVEQIGRDAKSRRVGGNGSDILVGAKSIFVTLDQVREIVNDTKFKDNAIIVLAEEDQSKLQWSGQAGLERAKYYQYSDAIFTSNEGTIKWCSSQDCIETVRKKLPCLWGSDAHDYNKLFSFDQDRQLWIKSDVTFNGLLYALSRFENRIFIGSIPDELKELEKRKSYTIKQLSVKPNTTNLAREWFDADIKFNPFMTTIIGNKGSGKSAVSDIIAYMSNSHKMPTASFLNKQRFLDKKTKYGEDYNALLTFLDTERQPIFKDVLSDSFNAEEVEAVKYLPQSYIEEICNNLDNKFQDEIDNTIFSYVRTQDRGESNTLKDLINSKTIRISESILQLQTELKKVNSEIIALEDKSTQRYKDLTNNELKSLKEKRNNHLKIKPKEVKKPEDIETSAESKRIVKLSEWAAANDSQIEDSLTKLSTTNRHLQQIDDLFHDINNLLECSQKINDAFKQLIASKQLDNTEIVKIVINDSELKNLRQTLTDEKETLEILTCDTQTDISLTVASIDIFKIDEIEDKFNDIQNLYDKKDFLNTIIRQLKDNISTEQLKYFEYKKALEEWESYKSMLEGDVVNTIDGTSIRQLEDELKYLNETLEITLQDKRKQRIEIIRLILKQIYKKQTALTETYSPVQDKIESIEALGNSNIMFRSSIVVNTGRLIENILHFIDQRVDSVFRGTKGGHAFLEDLIESTDFSKEEAVIDFVKKLYSSTTDDIDNIDQLVKDRMELNQLIGNLDYLEPKYTISAEGKSLNELSPGERGIVLLIFYLALDKGNIPLIIDQPEDNLDNQSVYSKLVPAIKKAKKNRQIIIVTHNPNIAIACDSEGIIYCSHDKESLQYITASIENEKMNNHIIDVLEGTVPAFNVRRNSYKEIK